ncbi:MAG: hypothetical protein DWH91_14415 [Planctomycetota bacterium]|nr:MAG: hypothetical protein DWH91_14415 [Planctomycetota bacterium]
MAYIADLTVIEGGSSDISPDDPAYYKIPVDLNAGAGGRFLYLCFKQAEGAAPDDDQAAIRGLYIISGNNADIPAPNGFTKFPLDLNKGAGGDFIYLCFTRLRALGAPLQDVSVVAGGSASVPAPTGYTKFPVDLNKGAGGAFIYACYR